MDIQVGDRVTYKYKDKIYIKIILDEYELSVLKDDDREILKIERPKYKVVEEKKDLLTEEEKEFLKYYIKIRKEKITHIILNCYRNEKELILVPEDDDYSNYIPTEKFLNLEADKKYSLKELGLEEN